MDDQAKTAVKAEDYIRYQTRQEVKQRDIKVDEQGRICVDKHKSTTINHVELANNFVKLASIVPMSPMSRKIIQLRIVNPGISITGVSLQVGLLAHEIKAYEQDGINRITSFLKRTSIQESIEKANSESAVEYAVKNLNMQGKENSLLK